MPSLYSQKLNDISRAKNPNIFTDNNKFSAPNICKHIDCEIMRKTPSSLQGRQQCEIQLSWDKRESMPRSSQA